MARLPRALRPRGGSLRGWREPKQDRYVSALPIELQPVGRRDSNPQPLHYQWK